MNTVFDTNFVVMPTDANYLAPLIFGGAFFSKMDLCAAKTVDRLLHDSKTCKGAITHKASVTWLKPCYVGDTVYLRGKVKSVGKKSVVVSVTATREKRGKPEIDLVGTGEFIFVTIHEVAEDDINKRPDMLPYAPHGITLESDK